MESSSQRRFFCFCQFSAHGRNVLSFTKQIIFPTCDNHTMCRQTITQKIHLKQRQQPRATAKSNSLNLQTRPSRPLQGARADPSKARRTATPTAQHSTQGACHFPRLGPLLPVDSPRVPLRRSLYFPALLVPPIQQHRPCIMATGRALLLQLLFSCTVCSYCWM